MFGKNVRPKEESDARRDCIKLRRKSPISVLLGGPSLGDVVMKMHSRIVHKRFAWNHEGGVDP